MASFIYCFQRENNIAVSSFNTQTIIIPVYHEVTEYWIYV